MRIDALDVWVVNVGYRSAFVSSFETRRGTTRTVIRLRTDDGLVGWGETMHGEPVAALVTKLFERYRGTDPHQTAARAAETEMVPFFYGYLGYAAMAALEMACHDLMARAAGVPLHDLIGGRTRDRVELTYVATPPEDGADAARRIVEDVAAVVDADGYPAVKLKGSHDPAVDLGYLEALQERFPDLPLRVDPNGHWPLPATLAAAARIEAVGLQYLEDPCWGLSAMGQVRARVRVPLCTNMCVVRFEDIAPALEIGAVDIVHGDVFKWGGIVPTMRLAGVCAAAGWGMNLHSGGELGLATAAHLHVVAATPEIGYPIDTVYYLYEDDILPEPLVIEHGSFAVPGGVGLGVEPDMDKLAHYAARHDRDGDLLM